jgi:hypothetical protein
MVANFVNFDEEQIELQLRGEVLSGHGEIALYDEPIAGLGGGIPEPHPDKPKKCGTANKMTVAPLGMSFKLVTPNLHYYLPT